MNELNKKNSRLFSRLGQRGTICGKALSELLNTNDNCIVLTADLATLSGLERIKNDYPDRFINVGIAEQNLIGVASGLAFSGDVPFVTTYATFVTMRPFEQIRHNLGYQKANVKIIGSSAGFAMGMSGNTHYTYEDISIMRSIPGMIVLSPSDAGMAYKSVFAAAEINGPVYIRLTGNLNCPVVYEDEYDFDIGKSIEVIEGNDIAIFATGTMVSEAIKVSRMLADNKGISASVIDVYCIKPIDIERINKQKSKKLFVTMEEHSVVGGLASSISEITCSENGFPPILKFGVNDVFLKPDDYESMLKKAGLTAEEIYARIIDRVLEY